MQSNFHASHSVFPSVSLLSTVLWISRNKKNTEQNKKKKKRKAKGGNMKIVMEGNLMKAFSKEFLFLWIIANLSLSPLTLYFPPRFCADYGRFLSLKKYSFFFLLSTIYFFLLFSSFLVESEIRKNHQTAKFLLPSSWLYIQFSPSRSLSLFFDTFSCFLSVFCKWWQKNIKNPLFRYKKYKKKKNKRKLSSIKHSQMRRSLARGKQ